MALDIASPAAQMRLWLRLIDRAIAAGWEHRRACG